MLYINIFGVICTAFCCISTLWAKHTEKICSQKQIRNLLLAVLFVFSIGIRLFKFGALPDALNQDSTMAAVNAYSLLQHGTDIDGMEFPVYFTAWGDSQMNVMMSYMMIPWIKLLGLNRISILMPTIIMSICGMVAGCKLVDYMFGGWMPVLFMAVISCNPWHYISSRWALESNLFPHFFVIGVLLLACGINKKKTRMINLSVFIMGLSHYNYGLSIYVVPVFLLIICIYMLKSRIISFVQAAISLAIYFVVSWPFYLMIIINIFSLPTIELPFMTIPSFDGGARSSETLLFSKEPLSQLLENFKNLIKLTFFQSDGLIWSSVPNFGTVMLFLVPLMILGFIRVCGAKTKTVSRAIIFAWLAVSFFDGIITNEINSTRLNVAMYLSVILVACGLMTILESGKLRISIMAVICAGMYGLFIFDYFTVYQDRFFDREYAYSGNFTKALSKAYDVSLNDENVKYVITPDSQYPGATLISEVDNMFIWKIDSDYRLGLTDLYDATGEHTPYIEKFDYSVISSEKVLDNDFKTVYVIESSYMDIFDDDYSVYKYGQFATCVPKAIE